MENWGRNIKTKQSPNPSVSHQPCSCSSPPICKPTTGGAGFAPRQSYNRCYLAHIWTEVRKKKITFIPKSCQKTSASFKKLPRLGKDNTATARAQACAGAAILLPRHPLCRAENSASRHTHTHTRKLRKATSKGYSAFWNKYIHILGFKMQVPLIHVSPWFFTSHQNCHIQTQ